MAKGDVQHATSVELRETIYGLRNTQVGSDLSAVWANSAAVNTQVNVDAALPETVNPDAKALLIVYNPSTVTALTVRPKVQANTMAGATRYGELPSFAVAAGATKAQIVEGLLLGNGLRVTLSNDTVLGVSDGFTATVRIIHF